MLSKKKRFLSILFTINSNEEDSDEETSNEENFEKKITIKRI